MNRDVIIACDFADRASTLAFLDRFTEEKPFVKIGMELFYAEGPEIVREIKRRGHRIFLDLKLCDIPNTVMKAMAVLSRLDVDMVNLHAFGTVEMMRAALKGLTRPDGTRPLLIAVTQLTSTSQERMERDLLIEKPLSEVVNVLREAGAEVLGIASIFTYGMKKGLDRMAEAHVQNVSLTDFDAMAEAAAQEGYIQPDDIRRLIAFRDNPSDESWIGGAK